MLIKAWIFNNLQHYIGNKLSKDTGFSISSAERYSLALFELSEENNLLSQIEEQSLSVLNLINQSKDFFNLIKDPTTRQEDLSKVINEIVKPRIRINRVWEFGTHKSTKPPKAGNRRIIERRLCIANSFFLPKRILLPLTNTK